MQMLHLDMIGLVISINLSTPGQTQLSYNLNCLLSRAKLIFTSSYVSGSYSDLQNSNSNLSPIQS